MVYGGRGDMSFPQMNAMGLEKEEEEKEEEEGALMD